MQSECLQWGSHESRDAALQVFASENISMNLLFFFFFALITAVTSPVKKHFTESVQLRRQKD